MICFSTFGRSQTGQVDEPALALRVVRFARRKPAFELVGLLAGKGVRIMRDL